MRKPSRLWLAESIHALVIISPFPNRGGIQIRFQTVGAIKRSVPKSENFDPVAVVVDIYICSTKYLSTKSPPKLETGPECHLPLRFLWPHQPPIWPDLSKACPH